MSKRAFLGDDTRAYQYRMDTSASCGGQCEDVGSLRCSTGASKLTMRQVGDPALFGRSPLTSGSPLCAMQPVVNKPCPARKCSPMWSGFVPDTKTSLKEVDMTKYVMMPRSFPDGYNGLDFTLNRPSRLLSSLAANQQEQACQSQSPYRTYGRIV
jgi:hypothetical protein